MHRRQSAGVGGTGGAGVPSSPAPEHMTHGGILKAPSDMAHEVHARADSTLSSNPSIPRTPTSMPSMAKTPQHSWFETGPALSDGSLPCRSLIGFKAQSLLTRPMCTTLAA